MNNQIKLTQIMSELCGRICIEKAGLFDELLNNVDKRRFINDEGMLYEINLF